MNADLVLRKKRIFWTNDLAESYAVLGDIGVAKDFIKRALVCAVGEQEEYAHSLLGSWRGIDPRIEDPVLVPEAAAARQKLQPVLDQMKV